jgi:signal peptidase I
MSDSGEEIKISRKFKNAQKKANRAYIKAVLFFMAMILIETFFPRYQDFNTVRRTSIEDIFSFIDIPTELSFLTQFSMLYSLIFLGIILMIPTFLKARKMEYNQDSEKKQIKKLNRYHSRIDYVYYVALVGFILVFLNTFFISMAQVSGASMEPLFFDRDDVLIHHRMNDLSRGDVVVVADPDRDSVYIVKRIIGFPKERIEIKTGRVYIDGDALEEAYISGMISTSCQGEYCDLTLAEDEYYVIGDNRTNSNDSRRMGPFTMDDFLGEVIFILRPFDRLGRVQP